jgi:hypothetical protein
MAVVTVDCVSSIQSYFYTRLSMKNPLIPGYIIEELARPHLAWAAFKLAAVVISLLFFRKQKYALVIATCAAALIIPLFFFELVGG